jgi:hypothetical protein
MHTKKVPDVHFPPKKMVEFFQRLYLLVFRCILTIFWGENGTMRVTFLFLAVLGACKSKLDLLMVEKHKKQQLSKNKIEKFIQLLNFFVFLCILA